MPGFVPTITGPYEPHREKTGLRGFQPGPTQIGCRTTYDYRLEILDEESRGIVLST